MPKAREMTATQRDALLKTLRIAKALDARKEHKPKSSAVEMAAAMGAMLLTVDEYQQLS
jgi:hypothetical protein